MNTKVLSWVVLFAGLISVANGGDEKPMKREMAGMNITIVGFGDSITQATTGMPDPKDRWLSLLKSKLDMAFPGITFNVINSGVGGNSAREAMARFNKDVASHTPDWVILEFGGNNNDYAQPKRVVELQEFNTLLAAYKKGLPAKTKTIVVTFPPVFQDLHVYGKDPVFQPYWDKAGGMDKAAEPYRDAVRTFAAGNGYPVFDLHKVLLGLGAGDKRLQYTMKDGVHLTKDGNRVLAEGVFAILQKEVGANH